MFNKGEKYRIKEIEVVEHGTLGYDVFGKAFQVQERWWPFGYVNLRKPQNQYVYAAFYTTEQAQQFIDERIKEDTNVNNS